MDLIIDFPPSPRPNNEEQRVSFVSKVKVMFIENLTYQYKADLWFSRQEMVAFKRRVQLTLSVIRSRNLTVAKYAKMNAPDTSLFMGLEAYQTSSTAVNIASRRRAVWSAVLLEQHIQLVRGICDPDKIAVLSKVVTGVAQERAQIIALIHLN